MRTTIVPAQITTVEDRIAGNLGLSQIMLLVTPIFGGSIMFVILPPFFNYAVYKVILIAIAALICGLLAVRIKSKILLFWVLTIARYNFRPMYYVFNKNNMHAREVIAVEAAQEPRTQAETEMVVPEATPQLSMAEQLRIETVLSDPAANLHFTTTKKGALRVHLTENSQQSVSAPAN